MSGVCFFFICICVYAHGIHVRCRMFCLEVELVTKCNLEYRVLVISILEYLC